MEVARVREPFSFGVPERRRLAMQFGYDMQPSLWQGVRSNAHLVIAAVGTAALLGVAAVALWLALPAGERQAAASPEQIVPAVPVKTKKIAATANVTVAAVDSTHTRPKVEKASVTIAAPKAPLPALAANDPRWSGTNAAAPADPAKAQAADATGQNGQADKPATTVAYTQPTGETDGEALLAKVAAPGENSATDGAQTAAIPAAVPEAPPAPSDESADAPAKAKTKKVAAAGMGRILRPVTMRAGPKKNAAAIGTVPARTSVQVVSCKQWCEIVYGGKRGFIYKSYIRPGA